MRMPFGCRGSPRSPPPLQARDGLLDLLRFELRVQVAVVLRPRREQLRYSQQLRGQRGDRGPGPEPDRLEVVLPPPPGAALLHALERVALHNADADNVLPTPRLASRAHDGAAEVSNCLRHIAGASPAAERISPTPGRRRKPDGYVQLLQHAFQSRRATPDRCLDLTLACSRHDLHLPDGVGRPQHELRHPRVLRQGLCWTRGAERRRGAERVVPTENDDGLVSIAPALGLRARRRVGPRVLHAPMRRPARAAALLAMGGVGTSSASSVLLAECRPRCRCPRQR
mmetsp:Transcript_72204/g.202650  ORF Transcript_72204/g.202650 Transcript_72204/m.202650 type:complete len:284 (+) Transcript_72204:2-853(+)